MIRVIDSFLREKTFVAIADTMATAHWKFGWGSKKSDVFRFWHTEIVDSDFGKLESPNGECFTELFDRVAELVGSGSQLKSAYANGHTYGCEGYIHKDFFEVGSRSEQFTTAVLFVHKHWEPDWAGELSFFSSTSNGLDQTVLPEPNRLVLFPASLSHVARSPSRICPMLRISVVMKFVPHAGAKP